MPCKYKNPMQPKCQFDLPENELFDAGGQEVWCIFHLPVSAQGPVFEQKGKWGPDAITTFNGKVFEWMETSATNGTINLTGTLFPGDIAFGHVSRKLGTLPDVHFDRIDFAGSVDFTDVKFSGSSFNSTAFRRDAIFTNTEFLDDTSFASTRFERNVQFRGAKFTNANFSRALFQGGVASFNEACFMGVTNFDFVRFDQGARFSRAIFFNNVNFEETRFSVEASFHDVQFHGMVSSFRRAVFDSPSHWGACRFSGIADFTGTPEGEGREFRIVRFSDADFCGPARFADRRLDYGTSFRGATFRHIPDFSNTEIHPGIDLSQTEFLYVAPDAASAYMTLRRVMEDRRDRLQEGRFYALEQRCRRKDPNSPVVERFFSHLYDSSSSYGQSVGLPLLWLGVTSGLFLQFYILFVVIVTSRLDTGEPTINLPGFFPGLVEFTFEQMLRPFWIWASGYEPRLTVLGNALKAHGLMLRVLTSVQSILTLGLIAELVLAIRWRFRRG